MRILAFLLLIAIPWFGTETAFAHASLIDSEPADGAVLTAPPPQVRLNFSEQVAPLALRLLDSTGKVTPLNAYRQDQHALIVDMPPGIGTGTSTLSWRVTSQDGHPVGGTVSFSLGNVDQGRSGDLAEQARRFPLWLAGVLNLVLLATVVGGACFYNWIAPSQTGNAARWLMRLSPLALLMTLVHFVAEALDAVGDMPGLSNVSLWWKPVAATSGAWSLAIVAALIAAMLSLRATGRAAKAWSLTGLGLAGLAFALSGHAATAPPQFLMRPVIFLHVAAVLFWSGSLLPLFMLMRRGLPEGAALLETFSTPIRSAILILVPSGIILAIVQLNTPSDLWNSGYGLVLSMKLTLLMLLFALAAFNRFAITPRIKHGEVLALRPLKLSIGGEIALVVLIFGVTALWRFTPPPRELSTVNVVSGGIELHAMGAQGMANLLISPARPGPVTVSINVMDVQSRPLEVKGVDIVVQDPQDKIEPIRQTAHRVTQATWRIDQIAIPTAGTWLIRVNLLITDFDKVTLHTTLTIADP